MIFFTSDQQFNDESCITKRNRPFKTVQEMNEAMMDAWNIRVSANDWVYHLGDLCTWETDVNTVVDFYRKLKGNKVLIRGNHDQYLDAEVLTSVFNYVTNDPFLLNLNEGDFWLCHYPVQRRLEYYTLTGHIHEHWRVQRKMLNVGVDQHQWGPISIDDVALLKKREDDGAWDANVYPDAPLQWQYDQTHRNPRQGGNEPTVELMQTYKRLKDLEHG